MKLLLRPLQSLPVLLSIIGLLFAILLYIGWITYGELERQRLGPTDSSQWALYQTSLEFNRLNTAYSAYHADGSPENLKEFSKRFDIFYSRVMALATSKSLESYRQEPFFKDGATSLTTFVETLAGMFDRKEFARLQSDAAVKEQFRKFEGEVAAFASGAVQTQAAFNERARGALKWLLILQLVTSALVLLAFTYFVGVVFLERRRAKWREIQLREGRDLLRATVKSSLDGVLIADAQGNIVDLNDATADMFGFPAAEMTGKEMSGMIMPQRLRSAHQAGMARYAATGVAKVMGRRIEIDALRSDGTEFPIELSISSTGAGAKARYVAFMRDITERRQTEQSLKLAKERAEDASRAKAQFLASVSHEMRTPLTGILGALDLIEASELSEQQRRHVRTANRSGHALLAVISDVIDISRLEAGKLDLEQGPLDLQEIIEDVVEIIGSLAKERGNTLRVDLDTRLPRRFLGDAARIRQVLLNLATNAVKFTRGGIVNISATMLGRDQSRIELEIAVRDTGPGISDVDKEKLFKSFSQLNKDSSQTMSGSGLGLSISKRLVDLMSGSIGVDSAPGQGSRFWFRLTLEARDDAAPHDTATPGDDNDATAVSPKRVLVVDDNETVRSIVASQLASKGHLPDTAEGAVEALEKMKASRYDVVILDISMPVMDGFEALGIMRGLPGAVGRIPVIALTAHALVEVRERCLAAGFDQFLTKPVRADELARVIAAVTSGERRSEPRDAGPDGGSDEPLFDLALLKDQFTAASPHDLQRIIERFGTELDQQMRLLFGEGNEISPHHLRRIVHVLAGSSSMIGASRLASLAGRLDALAVQNEIDALMASVDDLTRTIGATREAVEKVKKDLEIASV
jgi:PAS domain S-box-containing protein